MDDPSWFREPHSFVHGSVFCLERADPTALETDEGSLRETVSFTSTLSWVLEGSEHEGARSVGDGRGRGSVQDQDRLRETASRVDH